MAVIGKFVLILVFFGTSFSTGQLIREPDFLDAKNFSIGQIGAKESRVNVELVYFNANNFPLQMKRADLDVFVDQRFVGKTILDTLIHVPAKDTFSVPVQVKVDMKNLFPNILTLLTRNEIELKIDGRVRVGRGGIFLNIPVRYTGKQTIVL